tara:strand:- start:98 stop:385 length:288 start_codon:yes stop_codon:yes gene_type:complete
MNTAKEKKLNAIKSEILEITDFLKLNNNHKNFDADKDKKIEIDSNDTLTLTNIVNREPKALANNDLADIRNELYTLKLLLKKNEMMLKEILLKIK